MLFRPNNRHFFLLHEDRLNMLCTILMSQLTECKPSCESRELAVYCTEGFPLL